MSAINRFECWLRHAADVFAARGFSMEVIRSDEDALKRSFGLMLSSDDTLGQLTIWDEGECFEEVGRLESGDVVFCRHSKIDESTSMDAHFLDFLSCLFGSDLNGK